MYETPHEQMMRLRRQEAQRREAERLAILATPLFGTREVVPVVAPTAPPDPNASLADDAPIGEWMARETERQNRRETERLEAETDRYGCEDFTSRRFRGR